MAKLPENGGDFDDPIIIGNGIITAAGVVVMVVVCLIAMLIGTVLGKIFA